MAEGVGAEGPGPRLMWEEREVQGPGPVLVVEGERPCYSPDCGPPAAPGGVSGYYRVHIPPAPSGPEPSTTCAGHLGPPVCPTP